MEVILVFNSVYSKYKEKKKEYYKGKRLFNRMDVRQKITTIVSSLLLIVLLICYGVALYKNVGKSIVVEMDEKKDSERNEKQAQCNLNNKKTI